MTPVFYSAVFTLSFVWWRVCFVSAMRNGHPLPRRMRMKCLDHRRPCQALPLSLCASGEVNRSSIYLAFDFFCCGTTLKSRSVQSYRFVKRWIAVDQHQDQESRTCMLAGCLWCIIFKLFCFSYEKDEYQDVTSKPSEESSNDSQSSSERWLLLFATIFGPSNIFVKWSTTLFKEQKMKSFLFFGREDFPMEEEEDLEKSALSAVEEVEVR